MRSNCAIQQAIYIAKSNVSMHSAFAITDQRCNDDFMLSLLEIMPQFWSF